MKPQVIDEIDAGDHAEKVAAVDLGRIDDAQNEYLRDILRFVGTWLVEHILEEDKLYM